MLYGIFPRDFNCQDFMDMVMRYNNIHYREKDFGTPKAAGMLTNIRDNWVIVVNSQLSHVQKRFTVGHELGHYFCHRKDSNTGFFDDYNFFDSTPEEQEANVYASEVLVPEWVLSWMLDSGYSFYKIAFQIGVSYTCLTWRLVRYLRSKFDFPNYMAIQIVTQYKHLSGKNKKLHDFSYLMDLQREVAASSNKEFADNFLPF